MIQMSCSKIKFIIYNKDGPFRKCNGSLCMQGQCYEINGMHRCLCYAGYTGKSCQIGNARLWVLIIMIIAVF